MDRISLEGELRQVRCLPLTLPLPSSCSRSTLPPVARSLYLRGRGRLFVCGEVGEHEEEHQQDRHELHAQSERRIIQHVDNHISPAEDQRCCQAAAEEPAFCPILSTKTTN
eukprot:57684-Hanusia_phi.AAC.3